MGSTSPDGRAVECVSRAVAPLGFSRGRRRLRSLELHELDGSFPQRLLHPLKHESVVTLCVDRDLECAVDACARPHIARAYKISKTILARREGEGRRRYEPRWTKGGQGGGGKAGAHGA